MEWLARFYRFKDSLIPDSKNDRAIKLTKDTISRILYSVRWNVVPLMGIRPQA